MEILVLGDSVIKHIINKNIVLEYEKPQLDPGDPDAKGLMREGRLLIGGGYISLQSESHPVEFRKVEIKKLAE